MYVPGDSHLREALTTLWIALETIGQLSLQCANGVLRIADRDTTAISDNARAVAQGRPANRSRACLFFAIAQTTMPVYGPGPTPTAIWFRMSIAFSLLAPLWPSRTRWR